MNKILCLIILTLLFNCFISQNSTNSTTNTSTLTNSTSNSSSSSNNNLNTNSSTSAIAGGLGLNLGIFTAGVDPTFNTTCLTITPSSSNDCTSRSNSDNKCCYSYGMYLNQTTSRCIPLPGSNSSIIVQTLLDFSSKAGISDTILTCSKGSIASKGLFLYILYLLFF